MSSMIPGTVGSGNPQLQSTISAATSGSGPEIVPHHPITCTGRIYYDEDGTFRCEHATAPPDNTRTQQCVTHSIALLIIELGMKL